MNRITLVILATLTASAAHANTFLLTGALDDGAAPANGLFTFELAMVGADDAVLWAEQQDNVVVVDGVFAIDVGAAIPLPAGVPAPARLRVSIEGDELPAFLLTSLVQADRVSVADQAATSPTATQMGTVTAANAVRTSALATAGGPTAPFAAVSGLPAGVADGDQGTDVTSAGAGLTLGDRTLSVVTPTAADRFAAGAIAGTRFGTGAITDAKVATNAVTGAKVGADLSRADLSAVVGEAKVAGKAIFSATAAGCDGTPFLSTRSSCDTRTCPFTLPNGIEINGRVGCDGTGCGQFATTCVNSRLGVLVTP
jgi:hypothetical protein